MSNVLILIILKFVFIFLDQIYTENVCWDTHGPLTPQFRTALICTLPTGACSPLHLQSARSHGTASTPFAGPSFLRLINREQGRVDRGIDNKRSHRAHATCGQLLRRYTRGGREGTVEGRQMEILIARLNGYV